MIPSLLVTETFNAYAPMALLLIMVVVFAIGNLIATHILGPSRMDEAKAKVYESGMNPISSTKRRFNVRFYVVAMTFLVFDVEIVFLYPWAVTFPSLDPASDLDLLFLGRMVFFVITSVLAFAYAWQKGVFRYD